MKTQSITTAALAALTILTVPQISPGQNLDRQPPDLLRRITIPVVDISAEKQRQVVVDREKGQYLGHVSTELLEDGKTLYAVYPKGHGRGAIVMKRSDDGGKTWSKRLPTPASWATSKEVPTIHRVIDPQGKKRLILWSGLYPARLAVSEDDGKSWSELKPVGDWGGIVVMGCVVSLKTKGRYLAMFHDDGRFFTKNGKRVATMILYKTFSDDGGLTWSFPEPVYKNSEIHLCEPGCIRSPDGKELAVLLRENRRRKNSHIILSRDEGKTWTAPRELPASLTGDRHTCCYAKDGRLVITFRDISSGPHRAQFQKHMRKTGDQNVDPVARRLGVGSPSEGDWAAWVGTYEDLKRGTEGQYRIRLLDNTRGWDTCYPGLKRLPDGTFVTTTYGHWTKGEKPYIVSVRFKLEGLDAKLLQPRY